MSCSNCGSEYCDGEKCDENGGQDPFPDPVSSEGDDDWGDEDDDGLDEEDDEDLDDDGLDDDDDPDSNPGVDDDEE